MAPLSRKIVQVVARRLLHSVSRGISKPSSDELSTYSKCYVPARSIHRRGLRFFSGTRSSPLAEDSTPHDDEDYIMMMKMRIMMMMIVMLVMMVK